MNKNCVLEETKNLFVTTLLGFARGFARVQITSSASSRLGKMPSILRHRLPSNYRPVRLSRHSNSCNRAKIFATFTVQSNWLTNCLQQLCKTRYLVVQTTSDQNHVCDISLLGPRANWVLLELESHTHTLTLFKLGRPKEQRVSTIFPLFPRRA